MTAATEASAARTSGLDLARAVSEYVVATFFGGDFSAVSSKDPHKSVSFAASCAREDLQMGAATLHRLVRNIPFPVILSRAKDPLDR